ncbi:MAG: enoyl-CoA hydratase/isomerase family protein [Alphaproteobacteria bacterium]|nr:enoyl-CoA hydratase/isomerase family protein [Alphaproteobacteria bacterium]
MTDKLDYVTIEKRGTVAIVRFDRKANKNAFDQKLVAELTKVALAFHEDEETQAVVLAGAPDVFSAGADLKAASNWDQRGMSDVGKRRRFYSGVRLCRAWEEMPQITIAAMERIVVGAGCAIALACDWRVLGRSAYLYVPEVKIGLNLQWGALPRLISLVGPARAKRIVVLCEKMGAEQALAWGLVDEIAEDGKTVDAALALAEKAASMPAATTRLVKEAINATAYALHRASVFADGDQSQLTAGFAASAQARDAFKRKD